MTQRYYTNERNAQIVISLLKQYGIKKVIASPGATNVTFVGSVQQDPFFEVYSSVDERSAAYMACGLAAQSGEAVVLSCTGATASRNYLPGLTEAFYRKLKVVAITSTQPLERIGHLIPQVIDRSTPPGDVVKYSTYLPTLNGNEGDEWHCILEVNKALIELTRSGGGPVHINLATEYSQDFSVVTLPKYRKINYYTPFDVLPDITAARIGIFVGSHATFSPELSQVIDQFCLAYNAVVFHDHTSGYHGNYGVNMSIIGAQDQVNLGHKYAPDLTIHIGEVSGDYEGSCNIGNEVWRISLDGEVRDTFRKLTKVFEMPESSFFSYYAKKQPNTSNLEYFKSCSEGVEELSLALKNITDLIPLSNIWIASQLSDRLPSGSILHLGILNSLRSWNFFQPSSDVYSFSNVGGFGIDGILSTLLGASLANQESIFFSILGDLAFFYDLNALGNRHMGNNVRILLVNNGVGTEFKNYNHPAARFQESADKFMAAKGHYGNKSPRLVKDYASALGFEYLAATTKDEFTANIPIFTDPSQRKQPIIFEVFTSDQDENVALRMTRNLVIDPQKPVKNMIKKVLPNSIVNVGKKIYSLIK